MKRMRFLPYLQPASEIIRSAMQSCDAFLELGTDFPGHSALEAALAGAPLALREHRWTRELLGNEVTYITEDGPQAIRDGVVQAMAAGRRGLLVDRVKQKPCSAAGDGGGSSAKLKLFWMRGRPASQQPGRGSCMRRSKQASLNGAVAARYCCMTSVGSPDAAILWFCSQNARSHSVVMSLATCEIRTMVPPLARKRWITSMHLV